MAEKKGTVVRQAAFLMAAQLICSVVGLLYRSPLHLIMGDVGDGYYTFAYEWYTIILLISSYSIPSAISKVMSERLAVGRYRNAQRVFYVSLGYVTVVGGIGALVAFFAGPVFLASQYVSHRRLARRGADHQCGHVGRCSLVPRAALCEYRR